MPLILLQNQKNLSKGRRLADECTKQKLCEGWAHSSEASVDKVSLFSQEVHGAGDIAQDSISSAMGEGALQSYPTSPKCCHFPSGLYFFMGVLN